MKARGIRNNNPLNIRHSADRWEGARMEQTDRSFVQFTSMAYGYRAARKILESYWKHCRQEGKPFTVKNIIGRWAPPSENDTRAYLRTVLRLTALGGSEQFPQPSQGGMYERMELLLRGMTTVECGIDYRQVDVEAIAQGFDLAFPGKRKVKKIRIEPKQPADSGVSTMPNLKGTTFGCWDEYWDW